MEQLTETVRYALTKRYQTRFSRRRVENVLFKVYRSRTGSLSDRKFCDLIFPGQMLFTCKGDGLRISFPSIMEAEDTVVDQYLVHQWAFDNTLLSVKDVILTLGLSDKGVPTSREAREWFIPDALMFAWAQTKLDFGIAHRVPVTCGSLLQKGLERISNSLRG
jgi:hypothetical protein